MLGSGMQLGEANTKNVIILISKYESRFFGKAFDVNF